MNGIDSPALDVADNGSNHCNLPVESPKLLDPSQAQ